MSTMKKLILAAALGALAGAASAGEIYKCTVNGKITYSELPCETGAEAKLKTPAQPARDYAHELRLERQKEFIERSDQERVSADYAARRAAEQRAYNQQRANSEKQRCDTMRANHKAYADDIARQGQRASGSARENVARAAAVLAAQCPG
jgi:hypothetical protein